MKRILTVLFWVWAFAALSIPMYANAAGLSGAKFILYTNYCIAPHEPACQRYNGYLIPDSGVAATDRVEGYSVIATDTQIIVTFNLNFETYIASPVTLGTASKNIVLMDYNANRPFIDSATMTNLTSCDATYVAGKFSNNDNTVIYPRTPGLMFWMSFVPHCSIRAGEQIIWNISSSQQPAAPTLSLSKSNPATLTAGTAANYGLMVSNQGTKASDLVLEVYDQLPANFSFVSASVSSTGSVTPSSLACVVAGGDVASGQLLKCTLALPSGGLPPNGSAGFNITVRPLPEAVGLSAVNKAAIDPSGANAAQSPANCLAMDSPAGCAVTAAMSVTATGPVVRMNVVAQGSGALSASLGNPAGSGSATGGANGGAGWVNANVLTGAATAATVGVPAQSLGSAAAQLLKPGLGARIAVTTASQILGGSCTVTDASGQAASGSATFNAANNSFVLDSAATTAGRIVDCTLTIGKAATMAWNITMSPNDGVAYVFATTAGPTSSNGLTSMAPFNVSPNGYTSAYTTLTKLYTDTRWRVLRRR